MLSFKNIEIAVENKLLFQFDELELNRGLIALVGRNGTGKTTFLNTILANHFNYKGEIRINDLALVDTSKELLSKEIAIVYTKPEIFGNHTVEDVLRLGRLPYQNVFARFTKEDQNIILEVAILLELESLMEREFNTLSDGEKQMVMIGRALVQDTPIILLDEPGAFLDIVNRFKLIEILKKIVEKKDKLILFSTHHIDLLDKYCDGLLLISNNKLNFIEEKNTYISSVKSAFNLD